MTYDDIQHSASILHESLVGIEILLFDGSSEAQSAAAALLKDVTRRASDIASALDSERRPRTDE